MRVSQAGLIFVAIVACRHPARGWAPDPVIGFEFGAYAKVVGARSDTLRVSATGENHSKYSQMVYRGGGCGFRALVVAVRTKRRSWNSRKWDVANPPIYRDKSGRAIEVLYAGAVIVQYVPPNGIIAEQFRIPVSRILGDSLPTGNYSVTALWYVNGRPIKNLRAGKVTLLRS